MFEQKRIFVRAALRPAAVFVVLLLMLFAAAACGGDEQPAATEVPPAVTAETGGMALGGAATAAPAESTADTTNAAGGETAPAATSEATPQATAAPVLEVGAQISARDTTDVYADAAPTAQRFGEYPAGTVLTVVEAGGDFAGYPVEVDGRRWYRVRAPDGLVGWVTEPLSEP
ncbi:MAG: hypothetical protein U0X20_06610 [Caldilineaceae bacterium]